MIREVRYVTTSFEVIREDHTLDGGGDFLGTLGGNNAIVPAGFVWLVDRIYYRFTGATGGAVRLYGSNEAEDIYLGDAVDSFILPAGAVYPLENTADEYNPVIVREGKRFVLDARNGDPNARIYIHVDYRVAQLQQIIVPDVVPIAAIVNGDHPAGSALAPQQVHSRRPFA